VAPTHRLGALVSLTQGAAGASLEDLERHISEDAGLSYRFVRLANSAFFGGRTPVGSIRQALMRLGTTAVSQWITLFALSKMTDRPQHLLNTAVHRGRLCELLAREYPDTVPERAFSAGLFSVLDALLGRPMPELIADLCLDDRLATAITDHRGPEGRLLAAVLAYERGDFAACAHHDVRLVNVGNAYCHAAQWADYATAMVA
jgi:c-di-GMP phosphodiesterase